MSVTPTHLLFESATGCAVFKCVQVEEIGNKTKAVQESIQNLNTFGKMVQLVSFSPFRSAVEALQACLDISEGEHWSLGGPGVFHPGTCSHFNSLAPERCSE